MPLTADPFAESIRAGVLSQYYASQESHGIPDNACTYVHREGREIRFVPRRCRNCFVLLTNPTKELVRLSPPTLPRLYPNSAQISAWGDYPEQFSVRWHWYHSDLRRNFKLLQCFRVPFDLLPQSNNGLDSHAACRVFRSIED